MKIFLGLGLAFALLVVSTVPAQAGKPFNSGKSFPYIGEDEDSVQFIVDAIIYSIMEHLDLSGSEEDQAVEAHSANYFKYARELAKTLSQLSPSEQNMVWYGS